MFTPQYQLYQGRQIIIDVWYFYHKHNGISSGNFSFSRNRQNISNYGSLYEKTITKSPQIWSNFMFRNYTFTYRKQISASLLHRLYTQDLSLSFTIDFNTCSRKCQVLGLVTQSSTWSPRKNPLVPQARVWTSNLKTASIKSLEVSLETIMDHKNHQRAGTPFLQRQAERAVALQPGKEKVLRKSHCGLPVPLRRLIKRRKRDFVYWQRVIG